MRRKKQRLMKQLEAGGKLVTLYGAVSSTEPCPVVFEENPGGHTHEADRRMARGILALLDE